MDKFELNSKVEIIDQDGHGTVGTLFELEKGYIYVSIVVGTKDFKLLRPGDKLEVVIYDTNHLVSFIGILESRESGDFMVYKIKIASEFTKFQRREYVRIPYHGTILFTFEKGIVSSPIEQIKRIIEKDEIDLGFKTTHTLDLSGGGVRIKSWEKIAIGQEMVLILKLDDEVIITKAGVRHGHVDVVDGVTQYVYGLMFKGISEADIDRIVKFVFLMMRKVRPV